MNKLVLVSGAGRGLGASIAESFVNSGYKVAINYFNSAKEAEDLSRKLGDSVQAFKADIRDENEISNMYKDINSHFSSYHDILVNNAMANYVFNGDLRKKAEDISWKEIQEHLDVTIKGSLNLIQALIPTMKDKKFGRIINISSVAGLMGNPGQVNYSSSKAALTGFTKSLAKEVGSRNITVNSVAPGYIETDMTSFLEDETRMNIIKNIPLGRIGKVDDVSELVMFLASDEASYITGQTISVDGGLLMY